MPAPSAAGASLLVGSLFSADVRSLVSGGEDDEFEEGTMMGAYVCRSGIPNRAMAIEIGYTPRSTSEPPEKSSEKMLGVGESPLSTLS